MRVCVCTCGACARVLVSERRSRRRSEK